MHYYRYKYFWSLADLNTYSEEIYIVLNKFLYETFVILWLVCNLFYVWCAILNIYSKSRCDSEVYGNLCDLSRRLAISFFYFFLCMIVSFLCVCVCLCMWMFCFCILHAGILLAHTFLIKYTFIHLNR